MSETPGPNPEQLIPMDELANVDAAGRAHRPNGEMMSNHERDLIEAHQDQISEGLGSFDTAAEKQAADSQAEAKATEQETLAMHRGLAMKSINDAVKAGTISEFSAGGDYVKATGLSHEDVMALGFNGFADLKTAAAEYQASQEASDKEALTKAEAAFDETQRQEARAQERAETRQKAADHAAAWRADVDHMNGKVPDLELPAEPKTFKEKFERGGDIGLAREKKAAEDAHAQAEAEAKDAADARWIERNSRYDVPIDTEGEKRTAELAELLKQHDKAVLEAQASVDPNTGNTDPTNQTVHASNPNVAANPNADPSDADAYSHLFADSDPSTPAMSTERLRDRLTKQFIRAKNALHGAHDKLQTWVRNGERDGVVDKRRALAAAIVGTAGLALAMKAGYEVTDVFNGSEAVAAAPDGGSVDISSAGDQLSTGTEQTPDLAVDIPSGNEIDTQAAPAVRELAPGSNPWNESIDYANELGYNLSNSNPGDVQAIDAIKDRVVELNNITDANNLPVGYELRMPTPEEIEELMKQYKK